MKVSKEDLEILKFDYSEELSALFRRFLEETGASGAEFFVQQIDSDFVEDSVGRRCFGKVVAVSIDAYDDEEDDEEDDDED